MWKKKLLLGVALGLSVISLANAPSKPVEKEELKRLSKR